MGQKLDQAHAELENGNAVPNSQPVATSQPALPEGVERTFCHKFETSGNQTALFTINNKDGSTSFRVTTMFNDGTIVRNDYSAWEFARKIMGKRPKEEDTNG